jgi:hypothetical protein
MNMITTEQIKKTLQEYLMKNIFTEFNDSITRNKFIKFVEKELNRNEISDLKIICAESNNTPAVVDRHGFVANVSFKLNNVLVNFEIAWKASGPEIKTI